MSKGTLMLNTDIASRKMSYSKVEGVIYMSTKSNSNKIAQIKQNNQVTIDLDENKYIASLVSKDDADFEKIKEIYLSTMPKFQILVYKYLFGRNNDMFIILNEAK